MQKDNIIEKLKDDKHYYGEFGKKYLSNSDLKCLSNEGSAKEFRSPKKYTIAEMINLEKGKYFHQLMLEPTKSKDFPILPPG